MSAQRLSMAATLLSRSRPPHHSPRSPQIRGLPRGVALSPRRELLGHNADAVGLLRHTSGRSLERYARPGVHAVAQHVAERDAKLDRIEEVLDRFRDRVFAFDEFGPLGIRPTAGSGWAEQGRPDRLPATYHRTHGVRYFHGCYSVGDDTLWGVNRRKRGAVNTLAALKSIRAARPDGAPIYVILDNLSDTRAPTSDAGRRNTRSSCASPDLRLVNPIEAHFGPLRQFTIANSHHPNHTVQTRTLHAYLRWRNANARHRDVLAAERKERARIRSEKGIRWGGRPALAA